MRKLIPFTLLGVLFLAGCEHDSKGNTYGHAVVESEITGTVTKEWEEDERYFVMLDDTTLYRINSQNPTLFGRVHVGSRYRFLIAAPKDDREGNATYLIEIKEVLPTPRPPLEVPKSIYGM
jgi:hypothetical protein